MNISLLYGTETGNAEMLCEDLKSELGAEHDIMVADLGDVEPSELDTSRFHIFVCSTYGEGELPQSAIPFVEKLQEQAPDLSALRCAIFGLGDSAYEDSFANGSLVLAEALTQAKATIIGDRGIHDASGFEDHLEIALPWTIERLEQVKSHGV